MRVDLVGRIVQLEMHERITLLLPNGTEYFIKDAAPGHYGFQVFRENETMLVNTNKSGKDHVSGDIVYIDSLDPEEEDPDAWRDL